MTTWFESCALTLRDFIGVGVASASSDGFINDDYDSTYYSTWGRGAYTIRFHYDDTFEDFSKLYSNKSMAMEFFTNFEPGFAEFELWDSHPEHFNWPINPMYNQKVSILNRDGSFTFLTGRVGNMTPTRYNRRPDGSFNRKVKFRIDDLKVDFKRAYVTEIYPSGTTTYQVIFDIIENWTPFDGSNIDTSKGFVLDGYVINAEPADAAIQELLDFEITASIYLDQETMEIFVNEKDDPQIKIMTLTDSNFDSYVRPNNLIIEPLDVIKRNRGKFAFTALYAQGTVNVSDGSVDVIGVGTQFLTNVKSGAVFSLSGETAQYTVSDVLSDTNLRLSGAYVNTAEPVITGASYSVSGYLDYVIVDDAESIGTLAVVLGEFGQDAGVFPIKIPERKNPMTREQAISYVEGYVRKMSGLIYAKGKLIVENESFPFYIREGQSFGLDLPQTMNVVYTAITNSLRLEHTGAMTRRDANMPHHNMVLDITDRRLFMHSGIERLFQRAADISVTDSDSVQLIKSYIEFMAVHDCVGVDKDKGPHDLEGGSGAEEVEVVELDKGYRTVVNEGPYYFSPTEPGQSPLVFMDVDNVTYWS